MNNRVIKFRVWDGNEMHHPYEDKHITFWDSPKKIGFGLYHNGDETLITKDERGAILMQFTGLHDCNGKEIYEGDILDYCSDRYRHSVGDVLFSNGSWRCRTSTFFHLLSSTVTPQFEVIGNIYQNPELIKEGRGE